MLNVSSLEVGALSVSTGRSFSRCVFPAVIVLFCVQYGNFVDNLRLYVRGGSGGMGLPRLGGHGGDGGDVWVVAAKQTSLKRIKDKFPQKRFVAGTGANSRCVSSSSAK